MSTHTIAEAQEKLPDLIARARNGEEVAITEEGKVVVELKPVKQPATPHERRITPEAVEWLRTHRVEGKMPDEDAGTFVSRMRDEEWQR